LPNKTWRSHRGTAQRRWIGPAARFAKVKEETGRSPGGGHAEKRAAGPIPRAQRTSGRHEHLRPLHRPPGRHDAAGADASVDLSDLTAAVFPEADTVLFVDSLHYLPLPKQEEVLERAVRSLAPAGRIVVREVDSGASLRSRIAEGLERNAAKKSGWKPDLGFRSSVDIAALLERLGLESRVIQHDDLSIVHNALVVARRRW